MFYSSFEGSHGEEWNGWLVYSSNWESVGSKESAPCEDKKAKVGLKGNNNYEILQSILISTVGYNNISLTFKYKREKDLETSGDWVKVEWSTDKSNWNNLITYSGNKDSSWQDAIFSNISGAENQASLYLRFIANFTKNEDADKDEFWLDCVQLTGIAIPTCTDADGDGYYAEGGQCGFQDCDDNNASIHPEAPETPADGKDQNCDAYELCYLDNDGDGYRPENGSDTIISNDLDCNDKTEANSTTPTGDCNDNDSSVNPGEEETCNGKDDNCDGNIDEDDVCSPNNYYCDNDGDSYISSAPSGTCEYNCSIPDGCVLTQGNDCDDNNASIHPEATETCNGKDDNCDEQTDEGVKTTFYRDSDGDGYGNPGVSIQDCSAPNGYVENYTDCDDTKANICPGATDICGNGIDENCDGVDATCPTETGSIEGHKYNDLDKDGKWDETDITMGGWNIAIDSNKNNQFDSMDTPSTITDGSGYYQFLNIPTGTYTVCEGPKNGWTNSGPSCKEAIVSKNATTTLNFFNYLSTKYSCNTNTWQCEEDFEGGQYNDLSSCQAACHAPAPSPSPGGSVPPEIPTGGQVLGAATTTAPATEETTPSQGEVAGVSTTCEPYLLKYIKYGANNDPEEVKKLEKFLNDYLGLNLPVDGFYSLEDVAAVNKFQLSCQNEVLKPWVDIGLLGSVNEPTGYVYRTTQRWINMIMCPALNLSIPDLSDELVKYQVVSAESEGEVLGESTTTPSGPEELTTAEESTEETTTEEAGGGEATNPPSPSGQGSLVGLWILIGIIIVGGTVFLVMRKKK